MLCRQREHAAQMGRHLFLAAGPEQFGQAVGVTGELQLNAGGSLGLKQNA